jgi:hypothetical protein
MPRREAKSKSQRRFAIGLLIPVGCGMPGIAALADGCPDASQDIVTDRPSVTNSSVVVPSGSLQSENGINWTAHPGQGALDGTNSRLRLGIGGCTEMLVDLPNYTGGASGHGPSEFSDVAPAVKHQFGGLPEGLNLSATVGLGLPGFGRRLDRRRHAFDDLAHRPTAERHGLSAELPDRSAGERARGHVCRIYRRLSDARSTGAGTQFWRIISVGPNSADRFSCRGRLEPKFAELLCRYRLFAAF